MNSTHRSCRRTKNTEYGGWQDWRLPNIFELESLIWSGGVFPATCLECFPGTPPYSHFWSSSSIANDANQAWSVYFGMGDVDNIEKTYNGNAPRCVRGGTESGYDAPRFVVTEPVSGQQVVTDTVTGLMWQEIYIGEKWQQALKYCAVLNHGGFTDLRLPNKNELLSLLNYSRYSPASDFPGMPSELFWSSTTNVHTNSVWVVDFSDGRVGCNGYKPDTHYVRCVRLGP